MDGNTHFSDNSARFRGGTNRYGGFPYLEGCLPNTLIEGSPEEDYAQYNLPNDFLQTPRVYGNKRWRI